MPLTVSCFSKIQIGFTFLVPDHLGSPGKRAVKRVCVCVCVCVRACVRVCVRVCVCVCVSTDTRLLRVVLEEYSSSAAGVERAERDSDNDRRHTHSVTTYF